MAELSSGGGVGSVDTSSYARNNLSGQNPLDMVSKIQGIESQKLGIDSQKLALINNQMTLLGNGLGSLASDPNLTREKVQNSVQNWVKLGIIPADKAAQELSQLPTDPTKMMQYIKEHQLRVVGSQAQINQMYGSPQPVSTGGNIDFVQAGTVGGVNKLGSIGTTPSPEYLGQPKEWRDPATGKTVQGTVGQYLGKTGALPGLQSHGIVQGNALQGPQAVPQRQNPQTQPAPQSRVTGEGVPGLPLNFDEGRKSRLADLDAATGSAEQIRALQSAIPLARIIASSPTPGNIQGFQDAVALAKRAGILATDLDPKKDPQAVYQQLSKYLTQAAGTAGARSDLDAYNAKASNANVEQLGPAMLELAQNTLANRAIDVSRPAAFKREKGKPGSEDLPEHEYPEYRSQYSQKQDKEAFKTLGMTPDERSAKISDMREKARKGDKTAIKFMESMRNVRAGGFF